MPSQYDQPIARLLATLAFGGCLLCACGHTTVVGGNRTLNLGVTEYRLSPQSARASAGWLTIEVHNYGKLTHNLAVSSSAGQTEATTKPVWPGQTAWLTVALSPGRYQLASTLLSDQALGAYGTLTVTR